MSWGPPFQKKANYKILGIVKDMVKGSPFQATSPSVIFLAKNELNDLYIRLNPRVSAAEALPKIKDVFSTIVPSVPFDYEFVDDLYDAKFSAEERTGRLSGFFSVLAVFISCIGLFGLASYVAEQRTKEIGMRKVLGASVAGIWQMLSRDFVLLVVISCFFAVPVAYYVLDGWLKQYEYRMEISWWIFAEASLLALFIALLTVSFQSVKAALMNPVKALRYE